MKLNNTLVANLLGCFTLIYLYWLSTFDSALSHRPIWRHDYLDSPGNGDGIQQTALTADFIAHTVSFTSVLYLWSFTSENN